MTLKYFKVTLEMGHSLQDALLAWSHQPATSKPTLVMTRDMKKN
jgi:hypothetical protein